MRRAGILIGSLGLLAPGGCLAPGGPDEEPWPPRLEPVEQPQPLAESAAERRERELEASGATVFQDHPYH
jgi:hypothetical protein